VASDYSIGIFNAFPKNKGEQTTKWPKEKGKTLKIPIE
jgi:hypothetical protein